MTHNSPFEQLLQSNGLCTHQKSGARRQQRDARVVNESENQNVDGGSSMFAQNQKINNVSCHSLITTHVSPMLESKMSGFTAFLANYVMCALPCIEKKMVNSKCGRRFINICPK